MGTYGEYSSRLHNFGGFKLVTNLKETKEAKCKNYEQEGHEALNRSPEYTGQSQTFNFEIWMTFGQVQRMTLTFDTHSTSLTHLAECFKRL